MKIRDVLTWLALPGIILIFLLGLLIFILGEFQHQKTTIKKDSQSLGYYISFAKKKVRNFEK